MGRKSRAEQVKDGVAAAVRDSHLYRNIAERLATGRWLMVDWRNPGSVEATVNGGVQDTDDYVLVHPAVFASLRATKDFVEADVNDDMLPSNVHGWLPSGVEVRVYSKLPPNQFVVGATPVDEPPIPNVPTVQVVLREPEVVRHGPRPAIQMPAIRR